MCAAHVGGERDFDVNDIFNSLLLSVVVEYFNFTSVVLVGFRLPDNFWYATTF